MTEGHFYCSMVVKVLLCSGCFSACTSVHFPTVELNNVILFRIVAGPFKGVSIPVP